MRVLSRLLPAMIFFVAGSLMILLLGKLGNFGPVQASERTDRVQVKVERVRNRDLRGWYALSGEVPHQGQRRSDRGPTGSLVLQFSEAMVEKEQIGKRVEDLPLQLDPPMALDGWWRSYDRLEVLCEKPLRRATRYRVHLDPGLCSLSGLPLANEKPLEFESRGLLWTGLGFAPDLDRGQARSRQQAGEKRVRISLRFDLPLREKDLEQHLAVLDRKEKPRRILAIQEVEGSLGRHWIVDVAKREKGESEEIRETRWFLVRLQKGLRPRGRELGFEKTETRSLRIGSTLVLDEPVAARVEDLFFRRARFEGADLALEFERQIGIPLEGQIVVDPAIPFQVHDGWRGLALVGDFPPGKTIEVRLAKGFPGFGRYRLREETTRLLRVPDLAPSIEFSSAGRILSAKARPEIEVEVANLDCCELSVRGLYPNNLLSFAHREDWDHAFGPWKSREVRLSGPRNQVWHERLPLGELLGKDTLGIHEVRILVRDPESGYVRTQSRRILQITDLGVSVRLAKGQVALRVQGLAKGEPVTDAELRVMTPTNQVLVEGKTDARGLARLCYKPGPTDRVPFVVVVQKGKDRSVLDLDSFGVELYEKGQAGRAYAGESLEAWLQADRGIVRPGGTLHLTALVRDAEGRSPLGQKLKLAWKDPRGRVLAEESLECSETGLIATELATRPESATGNWSAELSDVSGVIGSTQFRVGAFVPARLEARVKALDLLEAGRRARVQIHGNWLDGAPAEARRGKLKVRYDKVRRDPKWLAGWTHGDGEIPNSRGAQEPIPFVLDAEGGALLAIPVPIPNKGQQLQRATLQAEVQDPSGRVVRTWTQVLARPSDFILAMRMEGQKAVIALLDPTGKPLEREGKLELTLQSRRWISSYRWYRRRWRWQSRIGREVVQTLDRDLVAGRAEVDCSQYTVRSRRWLVLVAEYGGRRVVLPLAPRPQSPDRLRIQTPLAGVAPGETARIAVDSPFAGKALVTLEGDGIHGMQIVALDKGHTEFDLPIPAGLAQPNLHVVANLTRSQAVNEIESPWWCVGSSPIRLDHPERQSTVSIQSPAHIEPESDVEIGVHAPGAREAVIALVDEGILSVTRHPRPDPVGFFLAQRRLDGEGMDTGLSLYGKPLFPKEVVEGGGGGAGLRLQGTISGLIKPIALWSGRITLDEQGRGRAQFSVPEYEGRLRVVAIAAGTTRVGASSEPLVVRAPISLRLSVPRMLAPGDESRLVLHLRNQTGAGGRLRLELQAKGGATLLRPQDLDRTWELADGAILDLSLPFVAGAAGGKAAIAQGFRVHASLGDLHRYVEKSCLVRPMAVYSDDRRGLALKGTKTFVVPGEWTDRGPKVSLRVSMRPDQRLLPLLESLVHYPYGCLEQTLSTCWPLLSCRTLLPRLYPEGGAPAVDTLVRAGIRRILTMQTYNGGLTLWPGVIGERPWLTVEALDFLLTAEKQGFEIPERARTDLLDRVEQYLEGGQVVGLRIRAAEVLARADRPVLGYLEFLGRGAKSREARARLALTYAYLEREEQARQWIDKIADGEAAHRQHYGAYSTPVKDLALELRARLAVDPDADRVGVLYAKLGKLALEPRKLNTQEQGQVLRELAAMYAFTIPDDAPPDVKVKIGDKEWRIQDEKTLRLDLRGHREIRFEAGSLCYAYLSLEGFRTDLEQQSMEALTLERVVGGQGDGVPGTYKKGEVYEVRILGKAGPGLRNLCLTDLLPGGFEFDNDFKKVRFERRFAGKWRAMSAIDAREVRDDRLLLFLGSLPDGAFRIRYPVRAVSAGVYQRGLLQVESLYDPEGVLRQTAEGRIRIED